MKHTGICGKPTVSGAPCQNPAGCSISHTQLSPKAATSNTNAVLAAAAADSTDSFVPHASFSREKYADTIADQYEAAGFDPDVGYEWWSRNFYPGEATEWSEHGFSPDEARQWFDDGWFYKGEAAAPHRDAGLTPHEARRAERGS